MAHEWCGDPWPGLWVSTGAGPLLPPYTKVTKNVHVADEAIISEENMIFYDLGVGKAFLNNVQTSEAIKDKTAKI